MGCAELQIASHLKLEHIMLTSTLHEAKLVHYFKQDEDFEEE